LKSRTKLKLLPTFYAKVFFSLAFFLPLMSYAQDIDSFACKIVDIFKKKDSTLFLELPIQPSDSRYIFEDKMKTSGIEGNFFEQSAIATDTALISFNRKLIAGFFQLYDSAVQMGVDWKNISCNKYNFEIIKGTESDFSYASGNIVLSSEGKEVKIVLKGMVKINERWRISFIDIMAQ